MVSVAYKNVWFIYSIRYCFSYLSFQLIHLILCHVKVFLFILKISYFYNNWNIHSFKKKFFLRYWFLSSPFSLTHIFLFVWSLQLASCFEIIHKHLSVWQDWVHGNMQCMTMLEVLTSTSMTFDFVEGLDIYFKDNVLNLKPLGRKQDSLHQFLIIRNYSDWTNYQFLLQFFLNHHCFEVLKSSCNIEIVL